MAYEDTIRKVQIEVRGELVECVAASYKGVPFFFDSADYTGGGREVQTNGIPFSNDHVNEDTGKSVPSYSFNIYFVGEDAENSKNEFLRVCGEEGAGELVHPYFGVVSARCSGGVTINYGNEQEYISGSVTFVPESDYEYRNTEVSLSGKTRAKSAELRAVVASKASSGFKVDGHSNSILQNAVAMSYKALDAVYSAQKGLQKAAEFVRQVGRIRSNLETILLAPGDFVSRLQGLITMGAEVADFDTDPKENVKNLLSLLDFSIVQDNVNDARSVGNKAALVALVRFSGASAVAESLLDCEFSSTSEAENMHDAIHSAFERMVSDTDDLELYSQAIELEAVALKHVRDNMSRIPYEVAVSLPRTNNLLSIAYGIHGDLEGVEEIFEGNALRDPLFVKPSERLRVICHD